MSQGLRRTLRLLFGPAIGWLVFGVLLGFLAEAQLVWPRVFDACSWLTYGRLAPAAVDALVYGWASSAGIGVAFWLFHRLGARPVGSTLVAEVAAVFWHVGVLCGIVGILSGSSTGVFLLEFPLPAAVILLTSFLALTGWGWLQFSDRAVRATFASSWYAMGAFLFFPWLYASGVILLIGNPVAGPAQGPIAAWFANGLLCLWLGSLALAGLYYLVPAILGQRLPKYRGAALGFWMFITLSALGGMASLIGGPVPLWMVTVGCVARGLLVIPAALILRSLLGALKVTSPEVGRSASLRFAVASLIAFAFSTWLGALFAWPGVSGFLNFTDVLTAQGTLFLVGFVTLALMGAMIHILPLLMGRDNPERMLGRIFWLGISTTGLLVLCLFLGGLLQALAQSDPGLKFHDSVRFVTPFRFLATLAAFGGLITVSSFAVWYRRMTKHTHHILP